MHHAENPVRIVLPLKTVDEHNQIRRELREERERQARLTGVACPQCGKELKWSQYRMGFPTFPPPTTAPAECEGCSLTVQLER